MTDEPATNRPAAWRVTFTVDDGKIRAVGKQRVATLAPPDDSDLLADDAAGYWVEVRAVDGRTLHRQVIANPLADQREVFSPSEPLRHVETPGTSGVFQVLVPDDPEGHEIVVHGRPVTGEVHERSPRQLVKTLLREQDPEGRT
jgi:hypothetical protein